MGLGGSPSTALCLSVFSAWLSISNLPPREGGGYLGEARMDLKSLVAPKEDRSLPLTIRRNAYIHLGGSWVGLEFHLRLTES